MGPQPVQIRIDPKDLKTVTCKCGNSYFSSVINYKLLPSLCSPNGQDQLLATACAECTKCYAIYTTEEIIALAKEEKHSGPRLVM